MPRRYTPREIGSFRARQSARDDAARQWFMNYQAACEVARTQLKNYQGDVVKAAHATMKIMNDATNNRPMAPQRNRLVWSVLLECVKEIKQRDEERAQNRIAVGEELVTIANSINPPGIDFSVHTYPGDGPLHTYERAAAFDLEAFRGVDRAVARHDGGRYLLVHPDMAELATTAFASLDNSAEE